MNRQRLNNVKKFITFTDDQIVKRLRWVMIAVMLFSIFNTLCGQPQSFWQHPETAMRGDGLSIHHKTNHTFEFFLSHGWQAYLLACAVYLSAAFLIVSTLPRTAALMVIFSFIFGHFFGASNWLGGRWHLGAAGPPIYGIVLGAILVAVAFPSGENMKQAIRRLRWVAVVAVFADLTVTLVGQPGSFWQHPETMQESNSFSRFFLGHGWWAFFLYDLVYAFGVFQLVSRLPKEVALTTAFAFILGHFNGVSSCFFYRWRLGMEAPVIIGIIVSAVIVLVAFRRNQKDKSSQCNVIAKNHALLSFLSKLCP